MPLKLEKPGAHQSRDKLGKTKWRSHFDRISQKPYVDNMFGRIWRPTSWRSARSVRLWTILQHVAVKISRVERTLIDLRLAVSAWLSLVHLSQGPSLAGELGRSWWWCECFWEPLLQGACATSSSIPLGSWGAFSACGLTSQSNSRVFLTLQKLCI